MRLWVSNHCIERFRQRAGLGDVGDAEARRLIRREVHRGRQATDDESRAIVDATESQRQECEGYRSDRRKRKRRRKRMRRQFDSWFILSGGMVYVVGPHESREGDLVAVTCWPVPWDEAGRRAA